MRQRGGGHNLRLFSFFSNINFRTVDNNTTKQQSYIQSSFAVATFNKLAKLRRHASRVHFTKNTLRIKPLLENILSENILSENTLLENAFSETTLSENTLSKNTFLENPLSEN